MTDNTIDTSTMLQKVDSAAMASWSDDKRKDFVDTFERRAVASEYIAQETAKYITNYASQRMFISAKHIGKINYRNCSVYCERGFNCGRSEQDIRDIAQSNANEILKSLPPLKKAVQILDADTAKLIDSKEKMEKEGQKLTDELVEISKEIDLDDLNQSMTLKDFRKMVKSRNSRRNELIVKLDELGKELSKVDVQVAKRLYAGLPGLSDAIVKTVNDCYERITMLEQMRRRVKEQVMFGDSDAALEILRSFEKDEQVLSTSVKEEFKAAMGVLMAAGKKTVKQIKAKK